MNIKTFLKSKTFFIILGVIVELIILLLVFKLGTIVGLNKADFSYRFGANYYNNFGPPGQSPLGRFNNSEFINPHGASGIILKIDSDTLIIKESNSAEKTIITTNTTTFRKGNKTVQLSDLHNDDTIVVIGSPNNQGQIEAKFIRVLDRPAQFMPVDR